MGTKLKEGFQWGLVVFQLSMGLCDPFCDEEKTAQSVGCLAVGCHVVVEETTNRPPTTYTKVGR